MKLAQDCVQCWVLLRAAWKLWFFCLIPAANISAINSRNARYYSESSCALSESAEIKISTTTTLPIAFYGC
jgi:hypothetical protein